MKESIEQQFAEAYHRPGMQVCIEGEITRPELMRLISLCRDEKVLYIEIDESTTWPDFTEHDLRRFLGEQGATLIIAQFDNANQEVFNRITGLAKLLTDKKTDAKLIIVGREIYHKIMKANPSLRDRMSHISPNKIKTPDSILIESGGQ